MRKAEQLADAARAAGVPVRLCAPAHASGRRKPHRRGNAKARQGDDQTRSLRGRQHAARSSSGRSRKPARLSSPRPVTAPSPAPAWPTQLHAQGVDTLVLAGLTTECCIQSSAWDAFERDFHVFIAADACAAYDEALHRHALKALAAQAPPLSCRHAEFAAALGKYNNQWLSPSCDQFCRCKPDVKCYMAFPNRDVYVRRHAPGLSFCCRDRALRTAPRRLAQGVESVTVSGDPVHLLQTGANDAAFGLDKPLLETPRAVTLVSDTTIARYGISGVNDLTAITPSAYTASYYGVEGAVSPARHPGGKLFPRLQAGGESRHLFHAAWAMPPASKSCAGRLRPSMARARWAGWSTSCPRAASGKRHAGRRGHASPMAAIPSAT